MASKRIVGYMIDRVARELVKPLNQEVTDLTKKMESEVVKVTEPFIPEEIWKFFLKYPKVVKTKGYVYFQLGPEGGQKSVCIEAKVPDVFQDKTLTEHQSLLPVLNKLQDQIDQKKREINTLTFQIKCSLKNIRTFHRCEQEFPEAYKVLMEHYGEGYEAPVKEDKNNCDATEKIRATLSKYQK